MKRALLIVSAFMVASVAGAGVSNDPLAPAAGMNDLREDRTVAAESLPVPETGTIAITSIGLLAAAAYHRKRAHRQK